MRCLLRALALAVLLCGAAAQAGEAVNLTGRATSVFQYPKTETICLSFETTDKKTYMICDDVTAKDVIEKLFALGKKDAACRIEGSVSKKAADETYLNVTRVTEGG